MRHPNKPMSVFSTKKLSGGHINTNCKVPTPPEDVQHVQYLICTAVYRRTIIINPCRESHRLSDYKECLSMHMYTTPYSQQQTYTPLYCSMETIQIEELHSVKRRQTLEMRPYLCF